MIYNFLRNLIGFIAKILYRVEIIDLRKDKSQEAYVICANHISNWDPIFIALALPYRLYFMSKAELLKIPVLKQLIIKLEMIPVHRGENDITAVKNSIRTVKEKKHFCIFPQGTRYHESPAAEQFFGGVAMISSGCSSNVLPIGIYSKNYRLKFFSKVKIVIGDVITYSELGFEEDRKNYDRAVKIIAEKIAALCETRD